MVAAYKEMRAALDIAIEKATIIEKGLESIAPPSGLKKKQCP